MDCINYKNSITGNVSSSQVILLTANYPTPLYALNVCNITNSRIQFNLKLIKIAKKEVKEISIIKNLLINENQSATLLTDNNIILEQGDSLKGFTGNYNQIVDCMICYSEVNASDSGNPQQDKKQDNPQGG